MECIFCKIVNGEIPCLKIYETDKVLAFLDINPDSDGHTLVIPKKHYKDMDDIDNETLIEIEEAARRIKKILEDKLNIDGLSLLQNNGSVQEVKHYHLHLKPYYKDKKTIEVIKHSEKVNDPKEIYNKIMK